MFQLGWGKGLLAVASLVTLVGLGYVSSIDGVFSQNSRPLTEYLSVIDAGSHGSRIHLYAYQAKTEDELLSGRPKFSAPAHQFQFTQSPGISSKVDDPDNTGRDCIKPLLGAVTDELKRIGEDSNRFGTFPIFLKATAGMRDLDPDNRSKIMNNIRAFLSNKTENPFKFAWENVRVISGEEEGVFGWLTVNNAMGNLMRPANETIGSLDMGGASAQITFSPIHTSVIEDFYEIFLAQHMIRLYSHSFLGYGWGDAAMRLSTRLSVERVLLYLQSIGFPKDDTKEFVQFLLKQNQTTPSPNNLKAPSARRVIINATHPCYPIGHSFMFDLPSLMYPDGRFFLDIDRRVMLSYMFSLGFDAAALLGIESPAPFGTAPALLGTASAPRSLEPIVDEILEDAEEFKATTDRRKGPNRHLESRTVDDPIDDPMVDSRIDSDSEPFRPFDTPLPRQRVEFVLNFTGGSDYGKCRVRALDLFYDQPCFIHSCSFNGVYQPRLAESRFVAIGQFSKVQQALGIPENAVPNSMERETAKVCEMDINTLKDAQRSGKFAPFGKKGVLNLCWKSVWSHVVLTRGYGIDGNSRAVQFSQALGEGSKSQDPGWAEGSAIYEVNGLPPDVIVNTRQYRVPYIWAVVAAGLLAIFCVLLLVQNQHLRSRAQSAGYVPIAHE